jgi:IstB-like ATP binding protein
MSAPSLIERVKTSLVALKMPGALEVLDVTLRGIERGEIGAVEAIDALLTEELTIRENRRVKTAVQMARLSAIKTLAGFDFAFQPSLDRNRILALAGLQFIDRAEAVHLIGPPGTGKTHLSLALGVEAVERVLFLRSKDLRDNHVATLARIAKFLGLSPFPDTGPKRVHVGPDATILSMPTKADRALIAGFVRDDRRDFAKLIDLDISAWSMMREDVAIVPAPRERVPTKERANASGGWSIAWASKPPLIRSFVGGLQLADGVEQSFAQRR